SRDGPGPPPKAQLHEIGGEALALLRRLDAHEHRALLGDGRHQHARLGAAHWPPGEGGLGGGGRGTGGGRGARTPPCGESGEILTTLMSAKWKIQAWISDTVKREIEN